MTVSLSVPGDASTRANTSDTLTPASLLLNTLSTREGELLRQCAIPHQFSYRLLRVMEPEADPQELAAAMRRFARFRVVSRLQDGYALHDRIRGALFAEWLTPERIPELRRLSGLLATHFEKRLRLRSSPARVESNIRRWIYHLTPTDEHRGFAAYAERFKHYRRHLLFTAAENLLRMMGEIERLLSPTNRLILTYDRGKLALDRGNYAVARDALRTVIADPGTPPILLARAYNRLGLVHDALREWSKAIHMFRLALDRVGKLPEAKRELPRVMRNLGVVYRDIGDLARAEQLFSSSCVAAIEAGDHKAFAAARNALGTVYQRTGEYEKAICCLEEALDHLPEDSFERARVHNNLGIIAMDAKRWDESASHFLKSLVIKRSAADTVGQAFTYMNLVRLHRVQNNREAAIAAATNASTLFTELSDPYNAALAYLNLARLYARTDPDKAREASSRASAALRNANNEGEARAAEREIEILLNPNKRLSPWLSVFLLLLFGGVLALLALAVWLVSVSS